jgi:hypothetical protein
METPSPEFCVYDLDPHEYMGCVMMINEEFMSEYRRALSDVGLLPSQAIIVVGSDGKRERHSQSKTEFVLLGTAAEPAFDLQRIGMALAEYNKMIVSVYGRPPELRLVGGETLSYVRNNRQIVYPDRILNSSLVVGNPATQTAARHEVMKELTADGPEGKRIREKMEDQLKTY